MGRTILLVLLGGLLVVGVSAPFAEAPQLSDQEILKAWKQVRTDVEETSEANTPEIELAMEMENGPKALTDEELGQIPGAGVFQLIRSNFLIGHNWAGFCRTIICGF
jgi:hypothetical protein